MGQAPVRKKRIAVALSGGLDSAAAAALLVGEGHDVAAVTMRLPLPASASDRAVESARRICSRLGLEHHVIGLESEFEKLVIDDFVRDYSRGITPNPCIRCNSLVKFGILLEKALGMGRDLVAFGHYARLVAGPGRSKRIFRARELVKDQSYVLWTLDEDTIRKVLLPLGDLSGEEVSNVAAEGGIGHTAPPSQDICFMGDAHYSALVARRAGELIENGPIVDIQGRLLGTHKGLAYYTVGQRRGLGLDHHRALYVLEIRPESNTLVVGDRERLVCRSFEVESTRFTSGKPPATSFTCRVMTRYRGPLHPARIRIREPNGALVTYRGKGPRPAPGQSSVFYLGEEMLGGGIVRRTGNSR